MNPYPPNPYQAPGNFPSYGYAQPPPPPPPSFEFAKEDHGVFASAAFWLRALAVMSFAEAVVDLVSKDRNTVGAGLSVLIGILLFNAAKSFRAVVDTQGEDIPQLMKALDGIGNVLMLRIVMAILGIAMALLAIVLVVAFLALIVEVLKRH